MCGDYHDPVELGVLFRLSDTIKDKGFTANVYVASFFLIRNVCLGCDKSVYI